MRWLHFRTRLVGVHNPARCLAMTRICRPRLRRGCGSESRSGPGGDVEAARLPTLTGRLRGYRRGGATGSGCGPAARNDARAAARPRRQHWPSFFASEKPSGKRCDARGPSRNRPTVAPPMPRTEGKLPRNAVRDKRWRRSACGCKITSACALFFRRKNATAAFSAAMVAFNSVYRGGARLRGSNTPQTTTAHKDSRQ